MSKFKVGSRVGDIEPQDLERWNEYEDNSRYGTVTDVLGNGKVRVEWDEKNISEEDPEQLYSEKELQKMLTTLEKEFTAFATKVETRVSKAAKLLSEAADIAQANGYNLSDMEAVYPMMEAMRHAGWRTSSLNC